jgi:hypothetical protein
VLRLPAAGIELPDGRVAFKDATFELKQGVAGRMSAPPVCGGGRRPNGGLH